MKKECNIILVLCDTAHATSPLFSFRNLNLWIVWGSKAKVWIYYHLVNLWRHNLNTTEKISYWDLATQSPILVRCSLKTKVRIGTFYNERELWSNIRIWKTSAHLRLNKQLWCEQTLISNKWMNSKMKMHVCFTNTKRKYSSYPVGILKVRSKQRIIDTHICFLQCQHFTLYFQGSITHVQWALCLTRFYSISRVYYICFNSFKRRWSE